MQTTALIYVIALVRYILAWQAGHEANTALRADVKSAASETMSVARWAYQRSDELKAARAEGTLTGEQLRTLCVGQAREIRAAIRRRDGIVAGFDQLVSDGTVTYTYSNRAQREAGQRSPLIPSWPDYAPLVQQRAEYALQLAQAVYELLYLDEHDLADDWIAEDDWRHAATDAIAECAAVEAWVIDIAMEGDRSASAWEDERTVEEQLEEQADLDAYVEALDHTTFGRYEDLMQHRVWGKATGLDVHIEAEGEAGLDVITLPDYSDAETNPVMVASDHGEGFSVVVEAERAPVYRRLRTGFGQAMQVLTVVSDTRRRLEDRLLWGEEFTPTTISYPVVTITGDDLPRLRADWLNAKRAGAGEDELSALARYGKLAAWAKRQAERAAARA